MHLQMSLRFSLVVSVKIVVLCYIMQCSLVVSIKQKVSKICFCVHTCCVREKEEDKEHCTEIQKQQLLDKMKSRNWENIKIYLAAGTLLSDSESLKNQGKAELHKVYQCRKYECRLQILLDQATALWLHKSISRPLWVVHRLASHWNPTTHLSAIELKYCIIILWVS